MGFGALNEREQGAVISSLARQRKLLESRRPQVDVMAKGILLLALSISWLPCGDAQAEPEGPEVAGQWYGTFDAGFPVVRWASLDAPPAVPSRYSWSPMARVNNQPYSTSLT